VPAFVPTDPLFQDQWHLLNMIGGIDINVMPVWDEYRGSGAIVGVVDDGVEYNHPDLIDNYDQTLDHDSNSNDSDANALRGDTHGTPVAGLIAADDNGVGTVGVAPDATVTGFRISFAENAPHSSTLGSLDLQHTVDISNNSWGFSYPFGDNFIVEDFTPYEDALINAVENCRDGLGTIWVFSAGNGGQAGDDVNYHNMINSRFTIAVGATDMDGTPNIHSSPGAALLVSAPSSDGDVGALTTIDRLGRAGDNGGNYLDNFGLTSGAAPLVSGVVALMLEANPDLGYRDVQEILAYSSRQPDAQVGQQINGADNWNGGGLHFDHQMGFGIVDAHAAVRLAESWQSQSVLDNEISSEFLQSSLGFIHRNEEFYSAITVEDLDITVE